MINLKIRIFEENVKEWRIIVVHNDKILVDYTVPKGEEKEE